MQSHQVALVTLAVAVLIGCNAGGNRVGAGGNVKPAQSPEGTDTAEGGDDEGEIEYSRQLVVKKVKDVFPKEDASMIMSLLDQYGVEPHEQERERVQIAILKLSEGDMEELRKRVKTAKEDYRDVLAYAEYPLQMKTVTRKVDAKEEKEMREKDRKQYLDWLNGNPK